MSRSQLKQINTEKAIAKEKQQKHKGGVANPQPISIKKRKCATCGEN
jgi:hypothetical protein